MIHSAFVIQKHAARTIHYEFRLGINGVMKSWVVPKVPFLNSRDSRLSILTDDHSLSYNNFVGVIPKGEYGAGVMMIWDRGRYRNINKNQKGALTIMQMAFRRGKNEVHLKEKKVKGGFALVRVQGENWLLIKMKDAYVNIRKNLVKAETKSVKSGKSIQEIKEENSKKSWFESSVFQLV